MIILTRLLIFRLKGHIIYFKVTIVESIHMPLCEKLIMVLAISNLSKNHQQTNCIDEI